MRHDPDGVSRVCPREPPVFSTGLQPTTCAIRAR
jgi:hypothetical protein